MQVKNKRYIGIINYGTACWSPRASSCSLSHFPQLAAPTHCVPCLADAAVGGSKGKDAPVDFDQLHLCDCASRITCPKGYRAASTIRVSVYVTMGHSHHRTNERKCKFNLLQRNWKCLSAVFFRVSQASFSFGWTADRRVAGSFRGILGTSSPTSFHVLLGESLNPSSHAGPILLSSSR